MSKIRINGLKLSTLIGVHSWEREQKQTILVDLTLHCDVMPAAAADKLSLTIDYDSVSCKLTQAVANTDFQLIEALADFICTFVLESDSRITAVDLLLTKPVAIANAASVQIEMTKPAMTQ